MPLPEEPQGLLARARERVRVRARGLRATSTLAEAKLWRALRDRRLDDRKFRRQFPVCGYFADFACVEAGLIVELDGGQHFEPDAQAADLRRTQRLRGAGFEVLRFDNGQVLTETEGVLTAILGWLRTHHPHPDPLPQAGEGGRADTVPSLAPSRRQTNQGSPLPLAGEG
jgi:adenine-specific DNA-methyltransferase